MKLKVITIFLVVFLISGQICSSPISGHKCCLAPKAIASKKAKLGKKILENIIAGGERDQLDLEELARLDLSNHYIGSTDSMGRINFVPFPYYQYRCPMLGSYEKDWDGFIVDSKVQNGYFHFTVKFIKNGQERYRSFAIGLNNEKSEAAGIDDQQGQSREIWKIVSQSGKRHLQNIIAGGERDQLDLEELARLDLSNHYIGSTDSMGSINFVPFPNYGYQCSMLGSYEKDWDGFIVDSKVQNGYFHFRVKFIKDGQERYRSFAIGLNNEKSKATGINKEQGQSREIWKIVAQPGKRHLENIIAAGERDQLDLEELARLDLSNHYIGSTDSMGRISFTPFPNYQYRCFMLGSPEKDWDGFIIDNHIQNGYFHFTVKFIKNGQERYRSFAIGLNNEKAKAYLVAGKGEPKEIWKIVPTSKLQLTLPTETSA